MKGKKLTKSKAALAKVKVEGNVVSVLFEENGEVVNLKKSAQPEYVRKGAFFVTLNKDRTEIIGMRPKNAISKARFLGFPARENESPAPYQVQGGTKTRKDGTGTYQSKPYNACNALIELLDDDYRGMVCALHINYDMFVEDEDGNVSYEGSGNNFDKLDSFMEVSGGTNLTVPFSDNILPKLQSKLRKLGKVFKVLIKDGNIESFMEVDEDEDDEKDEDQDEDDDLTLKEEQLTGKAKKSSKKPVDDDDDSSIKFKDDDEDEDDD